MQTIVINNEERKQTELSWFIFKDVLIIKKKEVYIYLVFYTKNYFF